MRCACSRPSRARSSADDRDARELLQEQVEAGALAPARIDTLAYMMIQIAESFTYSDVITGSEPDVDKAVEVVRLLLQAEPPQR